MRIVHFLALSILAAGSACTTFSTVRSAEVRPGASFTAQASVSSQVGEEAAWFYTYECGSTCNTSVPGADLSFAHGFGTDRGRGTTIGFGTSGFYPYVEAYTQLSDSKRNPFGVGARIGIPGIGWSEHRIYGRFDFTSRDGAQRVLWNPGLVITTGASPNGENRGSVVGLANGLGLQVGGGNVVWTPSVTLINAHAGHRSYGNTSSAAWSTFMTAGLGITFRRSPH